MDQSTAKALGDWHYWVARWLLFLIYARLPKAHVSMQICRDPAIASPCPLWTEFIAHNVLYALRSPPFLARWGRASLAYRPAAHSFSGSRLPM